MYEILAGFAQTWGLALFVTMFLVAVIYAAWPGNRDKFREAAHQPLIDKDPSDD